MMNPVRSPFGNNNSRVKKKQKMEQNNDEAGGIAPINLEGLSSDARAVLESQRIHADQQVRETQVREKEHTAQIKNILEASTEQQKNLKDAMLEAVRVGFALGQNNDNAPPVIPAAAAPATHPATAAAPTNDASL